MSLKAGIVGLPNVGKSTLFNAITKQKILAANYPFATIDPNVGVVTVPDERLSFLKQLYNPERLIPTTFEFTDIAGLVSGASSGEGLGNKFLSHIREVDAICEVIRCFENNDIIHVENNVDPVRDAEIIAVELILADLEVALNRLNKIGKKASLSKDKEIIFEHKVLTKIKENLEKNIPLRQVSFDEKELELIKPFNFLTIKPLIYVANISEEDVLDGDNNYVYELRQHAHKENVEVVILCAKMESELIELNEQDKKRFLSDLGVEATGLEKLIKVTYDLLGLATFFTVGSDEVKAWTFRKGMSAPECAGIIHTDFQKGFIKAEVMSYKDLETLGDEKKVKENGKVRLEGKNYLVRDGDICLFRFNV